MKFFTLSLPILTYAFVSTNPSCQSSPKVTPKLEYDFSINLVFGPSIEAGNVSIYNGQMTYLSTVGGTFCAKWNGGVSGTVVVTCPSIYPPLLSITLYLIPQQPGGTTTFLQVENGTGPYKLEVEYLLKTNDKPPAYVLVKQTGWEVNFVGRTNYEMQSGDARYSAVNTGVWVGVETAYVSNATGTFCEWIVLLRLREVY